MTSECATSVPVTSANCTPEGVSTPSGKAWLICRSSGTCSCTGGSSSAHDRQYELRWEQQQWQQLMMDGITACDSLSSTNQGMLMEQHDQFMLKTMWMGSSALHWQVSLFACVRHCRCACGLCCQAGMITTA